MSRWIDFKRLKGELLFTTVLSHYQIDHNQAKVQDTILCPFHDDETPSCSINKDKGIFRCFGCDTSGNVLDFVCEMEGLDPEDPKDLAKGAQIAIVAILGKQVGDFARKPKASTYRHRKPATTKKPKREKRKPAKSQKEEESEQKPDAEANEVKANPALTFELQNLVKEHEFFDKRGISRDTVETFGLGLCTRGIMKDRIVIPIHNQLAELVAYAGRWPEEILPDDTSRYRFPTNFHKSIELFNLHRAIPLLEEGSTLFVVEGFWSAIRLHNEGFAVVAVFGHEVSEDQANLIGQNADRAVLVFDGDVAGRQGTEKAAALLSQYVDTRSVLLPEGEKPDTMDIGILHAI